VSPRLAQTWWAGLDQPSAYIGMTRRQVKTCPTLLGSLVRVASPVGQPAPRAFVDPEQLTTSPKFQALGRFVLCPSLSPLDGSLGLRGGRSGAAGADRRGQELSQRLRQREVDVLLADPLLADRGAVAVLEVLDALLDHVFRGARPGGDQHGLGPVEPLRSDLG